MGRKGPSVIIQNTDAKFRKTQVIDTDMMFVLGFKGEPISLRKFNDLEQDPVLKYPRTSSPHFGVVLNMAERLNKQFKSTDFCVLRPAKFQQVERHKNTWKFT